MPVPNDIQNNPLAYAQVWTGNRNVTGRGTPQAPGVVKARRFVTYIEVLEQGAHDPEIRTLAIQRGMTPRPMHRGRVSPLNTTATPYLLCASRAGGGRHRQSIYDGDLDDES